MSIDKNDKLTDVDTTVDESTTPYFTDVFSPWETKEQLTIWDEVAKAKEFKWTFDTSLISTTTDNIYNFSVADPSLAILSIWITWGWIYEEKTIQIPNSWALAYTQLETELKDWLEPTYIVDYVSWTNFTIQRLDKQELTMSNPNLVRNIELLGTNEHSLTDITVDWITIQIDWSVYTTDALWITYLKSQLSSSLYYMTDDWNDLIIARKDAAVPVITSFKYDRYTYIARGSVFEYKWTYNCNDVDKDYQHYIDIDGTNDTYTLTSWLTYIWIDPVTVPLLNTPLGNWSSTNCTHHWLKRVDMLYDLLDWTFTKGAMYQWDTWGAWDVIQEKYWFPFRKTDYSSVTITQNGVEVLSDDSTNTTTTWFTLDTSTNNTTVNVTTYTEIAKSTTLTSNNYFVPVWIRYTKIEMTAISSGWSSEWVYELRSQSCTTKYSTTTTFVADKIFKTDASNYWNIVSVKRWWFVINFTTDTSNKINFTCS